LPSTTIRSISNSRNRWPDDTIVTEGAVDWLAVTAIG
jgi:hypothetical protein